MGIVLVPLCIHILSSKPSCPKGRGPQLMNNEVETQRRIISDPRSPRTPLEQPGMAILDVRLQSYHCVCPLCKVVDLPSAGWLPKFCLRLLALNSPCLLLREVNNCQQKRRLTITSHSHLQLVCMFHLGDSLGRQ